MKQVDITEPDDNSLISFTNWAMNLWIRTFNSWIRDTSDGDPEQVWFVSREGEFLKRAWDALGGDDRSLYLPCSRAFLFKLNISNPDAISLALKASYKGTFGEFLGGRFAITDTEAGEIYDQETLNRRVVLPEEDSVVRGFLENEHSNLRALSSRSLEVFREFLESHGADLSGSTKTVIVDVGYSGTIQNLLESALNIDTEGRYVLTARSEMKKIRNQSQKLRLRGWLLEDAVWGKNEILDKSLVLENLLQARTGPCIDYVRTLDGVKPAYGAKYQHQSHMEELALMQDISISILQQKVDLAQIENANHIGKTLLGKLIQNNAFGFFQDLSIKDVDEYTAGPSVGIK